MGKVGIGRAEDGGGDKLGVVRFIALQDLEDTQQLRSAVELAVAAAEDGTGEEVAPGLADERCLHEARRIFRREAEEDLLDDVVNQ
jgi:hypothetical protein